ncbi:MAG: beta-CASP ribonuclease aCPSF1 [Candidatus Kariarchaeaceae archaeon]
MSSERILENISEKIQKIVPADANISTIEFEGPEIAIYSKNPGVLVDDSGLISQIARTIRKRVVIRSDPSIRLDEEVVRKRIPEIIGSIVTLGDIDFDESMGEVIIHVDKPGKLKSKDVSYLKQITRETLWRPKIYRIPPIQSQIIRSVRNVLSTDAASRREALLKIGKIVHRETLLPEPIVRITALGGYQEVGRSSTLLQTGDASILIDCGVSVGSAQASKMLPRFDLPEFEISELDAVIISHAHLDHCGFVPFLVKYGYEGPIYTTEPTQHLMTMLQIDYLDIAEKEGKLHPYSKNDIRQAIVQTITIGYGEVTDVAPGVRLTFHNAGHIVGSAIVHLHVGNGRYNLAFAHDFKFANSRLLDRATYKFPRLETMIMESTYGNPKDITPSRQKSEADLANIINETFERGGKVLIPVLAVGRAQELQLVIENLITNEKIPKVPVYLDGMIKEATAVTTSHPEFLSRNLRDRIFVKDDNPFLSDSFISVTSSEERDTLLMGEKCIIMATSGMLVGGSSVYYFEKLAEDENNSLIFVSYQGKGTLGRKVLEGTKEVVLRDENEKAYAFQINIQIHQISGFTGHSDRRELIEFAKRLSPRPKQYLLVHGEASKCVNLANSIAKIVKREALAPPIGTTTRLY